jgi:hypothetical protein
MYQLNTVGFDDYDWDIPAGVAQNGVLYYSADRSSVTFVVGNDFEDKTISVRMGACNQYSQTPVTLTLKKEPGAPTFLNNIDLAKGLCLPLNATGSYPITISNADPEATYVWGNLDGGWYITPTDTLKNNNYTINLTPQNDARTLWLKIISSCGTEQTYSLKVNRILSAPANQILTASGSTCVFPNSMVQFEVTNVDNSVPLTWSVDAAAQSNGWRVVMGIGNSAIIQTGSGRATITAATTGVGCSSSISATIDLSPKVPTINSASPICVSNGQAITFKVRVPDASVTYEWEYPTGWAVQGADNKSTITVIPDNTGGEVKVRAVGANGCTSDWSEAIDATPSSFTLSKITSCVNAGLPGVIEIQIAGYSSAIEYHLSIDDETFGTIDPAGISAQGVFQVNTTGAVGEFTISVSALNACGESSSATLQYVVQKENFEVVEMPTLRGMAMYYITDADSDDWYFSHDAVWLYNDVPVTGFDYYATQSNLPQGLLTSGGDNFYVTITNTNTGCITRYTNKSVGALRSASASAFAKTTNTIETFASQQAADMVIAPNPSKGKVVVKLPHYDGATTLMLFDMAGGVLNQWRVNAVESTLDISNLPNGTYLLCARQGKNNYSKQLILNK